MEIWPTWRLPDVRHNLIRVLTEVVCHSGHLDAARELIDGTTWLVAIVAAAVAARAGASSCHDR
ncbi:DUF664 domain-containing protein [Streptomyces sp. NPDC051104]|uniref:mycothiol transferase n=1 Tax=Streptomyces sp. NPDC051104 TaxID=3155044 RepID=UPI00343B2F3D